MRRLRSSQRYGTKGHSRLPEVDNCIFGRSTRTVHALDQVADAPDLDKSFMLSTS